MPSINAKNKKIETKMETVPSTNENKQGEKIHQYPIRKQRGNEQMGKIFQGMDKIRKQLETGL